MLHPYIELPSFLFTKQILEQQTLTSQGGCWPRVAQIGALLDKDSSGREAQGHLQAAVVHPQGLQTSFKNKIPLGNMVAPWLLTLFFLFIAIWVAPKKWEVKNTPSNI